MEFKKVNDKKISVEDEIYLKQIKNVNSVRNHCMSLAYNI